MSRSVKPRKMTWWKRWPGEPCIKMDLRTRGHVIEATMKITDEEAAAIITILFPKKDAK